MQKAEDIPFLCAAHKGVHKNPLRLTDKIKNAQDSREINACVIKFFISES